MSKKIRKVIGTAAPVVASFIPGVGPALGAAIGAGGGLLAGGGLKGALAGGLTGGALNGGGSLLGGGLSSGLGLDLEKAGASALGTGLLGAGAGGLTGGLKGALVGGTAAGLGGYYAGGGFDGLGESLGLTGDNGVLTGIGNSLGLTGDSNLTAGDKSFLDKATLSSQGFSPADVNFLTNARSGLDTALSTGTGGGSSSYGGALSGLLSGVSSISANDNAEKDLLTAQQKALSRFQPYVDAKFEPGDLTQDPGYQFRLEQGTDAINRSLGAKGKVFSGEALKAAQDYGQGLADTTYNEAYNRWLQQNQQNIGVAGATSDLDLQGGNVKANAGVANSNALNRSLSSLLGGYGAYTTGRITGYDPRTGQPIYA